jgi:2-polyprenyl-3-methyl-5-hydroxy-6-metoxy-1,4-benzoquinol methylase
MSSNPAQRLRSACNLCGSDSIEPVWHKNGYELVRCTGCNLLFVANPPDADALKKLYSFEAGYHSELGSSSWAVEHHATEARRNLAVLMRHARQGKLLDIGCSTGLFLELAKGAGFDARGLEYSPDSASVAQRKGLDVEVGALTAERFKEHSFDVVTMWDVIEHLPDPQGTLALAARLLKPGGLFLAKTPNCDGWYPRLSLAVAQKVGFWGHPDPPGHLFQFSSHTLTRLFEQNGLQAVTTHHGRIPLRYSFGAPTDWFRSLKWATYCALFLPIAAIAPTLNSGDDITLVGRSPNTMGAGG